MEKTKIDKIIEWALIVVGATLGVYCFFIAILFFLSGLGIVATFILRTIFGGS